MAIYFNCYVFVFVWLIVVGGDDDSVVVVDLVVAVVVVVDVAVCVVAVVVDAGCDDVVGVAVSNFAAPGISALVDNPG